MVQDKILPLTHANGKDARNGVKTLHKKSALMKSILLHKDCRPACLNAAATVSDPKTIKL